MNLETILDERLWSSIQSFYENRNFTGAILDAIYCLSDLIRERTGLESDGATLVGQAFGGNSPRLRVNKLQTKSDKDIQAGVEQLLRGMFRAIRNPRSHEKHEDEQRDADAIIVFVNYLLGIIGQSKPPFSKSDFLNRILDPHFVKNRRYAELLVSEIPRKQRLEVMLDVHRKKETADAASLAYFVGALLPVLGEEEKTELYAVISDEWKTTDSELTISVVLQAFPAPFLKELAEVARLRIENKLIESISGGSYNRITNRCPSGAFGTWARGRCQDFLMKEDFVAVLLRKLDSDDPKEEDYVLHFFWKDLQELVTPPSGRLVGIIRKKLKEGNKRFYEALSPGMALGSREWSKPFTQAFGSFQEAEPPAEFDDGGDDIPF